jgi:hypothetical protein
MPTINELSGVTSGLEPVLSGTPRDFINVQWQSYWTSTVYTDSTLCAWFVNLYGGTVYFDYKTAYNNVWPVRSGL